jgi:hypothetical protein
MRVPYCDPTLIKRQLNGALTSVSVSGIKLGSLEGHVGTMPPGELLADSRKGGSVVCISYLSFQFCL